MSALSTITMYHKPGTALPPGSTSHLRYLRHAGVCHLHPSTLHFFTSILLFGNMDGQLKSASRPTQALQDPHMEGFSDPTPLHGFGASHQ